jgi:hypothetical protein
LGLISIDITGFLMLRILSISFFLSYLTSIQEVTHVAFPPNVHAVLLTEKSCSARSLTFNSLDQFRFSMNILVFVPFIAPQRKKAGT